jgi:hypothetical protein
MAAVPSKSIANNATDRLPSFMMFSFSYVSGYLSQLHPSLPQFHKNDYPDNHRVTNYKANSLPNILVES